MTGGLFQLIHVHQVVVRKNEAEEEFASAEELRDHQRQHLGYHASKGGKAYHILSAVISRKNLLAGNYMQAKIIASVLHHIDFVKDPNNKKCPRLSDLKAGVMADNSKPYKGMMDALRRAREQARDLKERHSLVEEVDGATHLLSDIRVGGKRSIAVSSTEGRYCYIQPNGTWFCLS
jgi:hypothetical protein